jgi:NADH oxidase (H2O2-forming)
MKVVIIGAGAAGIVTSHVIKQLRPDADVTVIGREKSIFIRCSAPYVLAGIDSIGKCKKPDSMVTGAGARLVQDEAVAVDVKKRTVRTKNKTFRYDRLVFATGASPFMPPVPGMDLKNVFTLRTADDARNVSAALKASRDVVVIGGGMIGVETASLLSDRFNVSLVEMLPYILPGFDREFSERVREALAKKGVRILLGKPVDKLTGDGKVRAVHAGGKAIKAGVVLVSAGIRAEHDLAGKSGIRTGKFGIGTDRMMRTNVKDVYAVGDCAETFSMLTGKPMQSGLVNTAVIQAKVAGMNICGIEASFEGALNPTVTEIARHALGCVGLTEDQAKAEKIKYMVGRSETLDKYDTQPGARPLTTKLLFDGDGRVVGAQAMGSGHIVPGIINLISLAIQQKSTLGDLLKLNYAAHPELTPLPFADPVVLACENVR